MSNATRERAETVEGAIADLDRLIAAMANARPGTRAARPVEIEYEAFEVPDDLSICPGWTCACCHCVVTAEPSR